jgi:hypothetical protein
MRRRGCAIGVIQRTVHRAAALTALLCALRAPAHADVASDAAAAILVFPKILVDTSGHTPRGPVDTLIRVSNTSDRPITMFCFLVSANGHCSNSGDICNPYVRPTDSGCDASERCTAEWHESDFVVQITAQQPIAWLASHGSVPCEQNADHDVPCLPLSQGGRLGPKGQVNNSSTIQSLIPPVQEDPFIGELKCIAVNDPDNLVPVERNNLKGEAEIVRAKTGLIDVEAYNAVGIPANPGTNDGNNTLVLGGGAGAEYSGCPNVLILDHFFDGATDPISGKQVTTDVTLVPCTEDFATQTVNATTVQFLVFNEFEQRLSTSRAVTCFQEFKISDIDKASTDRSIFSAAVQGTLTGQTRIRGVEDTDQIHGHTLLGVAEEFRDGGGSTAFNLHFHGTRPPLVPGGNPQADFLYLP